MKTIVLIFLVLGTMGCSIMGYEKPKYEIGMYEKEFKQLNKAAAKVYADQRGMTIYRTNNGLQSLYAFFAFVNGKLVRYEEGAIANDYKLMRI